MDIQHPDSRYRWVIVAAGGFMGCVAIGSIFSLPVFLQPMSAGTGWSRADISLAMTFNFIVMGLASFGWGMVLDRFGPHAVLLPGSSLLGLGLVLASRASSVEEFQLVFGVLVGAGGGAIFAPLNGDLLARERLGAVEFGDILSCYDDLAHVTDDRR